MINSRIYIKSASACSPELNLLDAFGLSVNPIDNTLIPGAMRRRTSLTTRIAITAGTAACIQAQVDPKMLPSVFASLGGEIQVTDALCRLLPDPDALLSPTQFHNSVHNTTAGYWSILHECQAPTTAIAGIDDTFALGLLEAWTQLQVTPGDLLLVCYDESWPQYLAPPIGEQAFACAFVLSTEPDATQAALTRPEIYRPTEAYIAPNLDPSWSKLVDSAPATAAIPLLSALSAPRSANNSLIPLNNQGAIWCTHFEAPPYANP